MKEKIKRVLDLLPFNGKKLPLSLLILILSVLAKLKPEFALLIHEVIQYLAQYSVELSAGAVGVATLHRVVKR